ncbi:hypothetical protein VTH06DRAFT_8426 [Thermothelomyces fergusii]
MLSREFTRGAGFVCLRCRLQLAAALKRPPFAAVAFSLPPTARRSIGTHDSPSLADEAGNQDGGGEFPAPEPDAGRENNDTVEPGAGSAASPSSSAAPPPPPRRPWSRPRTFMSRGHIVLPKRESLGVAMLGKPGSAIVLRERRPVKKKPGLAELVKSGAADVLETHVEPASLLASNDPSPDWEDVLLNIHELRPKDERILTDKAFAQLRDTLVRSFTNPQLNRYIREYETIRQMDQEGPREPAAEKLPPWVLGHQPWAPMPEDEVDGALPHLAAFITKDMAPKTRLAVRLMRDCWDLYNQSVLDKDGYVCLRLRDVEFTLLTRGNRRWLEGTQRDILAQIKEVRLIRGSQLVSVVAPKHAADAIVERIHGVLSGTRTSEFESGLVPPECLDPRILEEVGSVTNTVTRLDPSGKKVIVTWIHASHRSEDYENACETVLRFLRLAYGPKPRASSALAVVPEDLAHQGRYLLNFTPGRKLPWHERSVRWERWTAAVPSWNASSRLALGSIPADILPFGLKESDTVKDSGPAPESSSPGWSTEPRTDTSVVFGHVVFSRQSSAATSASQSPEAAAWLDTSLPRTFIPVLPPLGSLNMPNNLMETGLWHTTTVIRFSPAPDVPADLAASAPDLELLIEADHVEVKSLLSLRAVRESFTCDVLFPAAPVDARLVQRRYFSLPGPSIGQHVPPVVDFLAKSDLRPWTGKLRTPGALPAVPLPRRLLAQEDGTSSSTSSSSSSSSSSGSNEGDDDGDVVRIDYALASVQIERTVAAEHAGLRLRYTSVQAGQRGGDRAEIALDAVRVAAPPRPGPGDADAVATVNDYEEDELLGAPGPRSRYVWHSKTLAADADADAADALARPLPVQLDEFLRVASDIVEGKGRLKWHAKRS